MKKRDTINIDETATRAAIKATGSALPAAKSFVLRTGNLPASKEGGLGDCPPQADASKTAPYEQKALLVRD